MRAAIWAGLCGLGMAGLVAACAPEPKKQTTGRMDFVTLCADCHGDEGKGDGPLAESLTPRPIDVTQVAAKNGGVFPKARVMGHIEGFTMGRSESPMPSFGDVLAGPTVPYDTGDGRAVPTSERLVALIEYVEGMQE
ncbi:cytochrome c [Paracoccus sp. MBLB3053]|uniref:Cytochrome c n=1 Tax=Paracoccus aurantius TaxID=3073814 RepID=A0ABU2HVB5_9RHOB|nr:cytochrome c [Paracoccus sp. MBLB3053]MDS9468465.1 cytochrome c [Paracoccus sp. MBLB3053]